MRANLDIMTNKEEEKEEKEEQNNFGISVDDMTKAGLQFGHKKSRIHPKMKPYLFGVRNTIFIIDLEKTKEKLENALNYINNLAREGKTLLMIGTKTQFRALVKETALEMNVPYVNERWLGGTFTNFKVIKKRLDYYKDVERKKAAGEYDKYTKKEQAEIQKEIKDLEKKFGGIKNLEKMPDVIFSVDMKKDRLAIKEARENGIKVIGIADVNIDPDQADYAIIANDDSISSVSYILEKVKKAYLSNREAVPAPKTAVETGKQQQAPVE